MHPGTAHLLQFFAWHHLPPHLAAVSKPFADLAERLAAELPENPELTAGLRKLLEAKDCAVRARLAAQDPVRALKLDREQIQRMAEEQGVARLAEAVRAIPPGVPLLSDACDQKDEALVAAAKFFTDFIDPGDACQDRGSPQVGWLIEADRLLKKAHEALGSPKCESCGEPMLPGTYARDEDGVAFHRNEQCAPPRAEAP